jgi:formiminotetrahydrofolate cyclodeaminase
MSAAMAAALVTMVGRGSGAWEEGQGIAAQARALRARLSKLGDDDAVVFENVLVTMHDREGTPEQRDFALGAALVRAAEVPLQIAEAAADVAELAALAASDGAPHLRPDAAAAAVLAEASVRAATHLVEINLAVVPGDRHSENAARLSAAATSARERALG